MVTMDVDEAEAAGLRGHLLNGGQKVLVPVERTGAASGKPPGQRPSSALFDDGNGGEAVAPSRPSRHLPALATARPKRQHEKRDTSNQQSGRGR